ncbi:MFS transporter [Nocardia carnea]|uniref:MFS transporter n=1 Tax=Nocardia carnea TaxID=37328 RepID=A0ABW7TIU1_9NOCA|nr:MFS transporter [Nocardia carnea]
MSSVIASAGAGRRRAALVVLCFVQFMLVLDDTVVSVALPSIRDELGFSGPGLVWVVNAYFLAFGGLLLPAGRAADLLGRRRIFLLGVALFGAASLACGLAQQPWQLVLGRFVQGAGAAMASPAALSLITLLFPGAAERTRALGIWGGIAALGGTAGLVISGLLTDLASWRLIFLINLPVAAAALVLLPRLTPESRARHRTGLDIPGAVLGTGAVLSLVFGLLHAGETNWTDPTVIAALLTAAVLTATFLTVESKVAQPLVPKAFLADRTRSVANAATLLFSVAFFSMAFLLMIHLQTVLGYSPLQAGLAYLPYGAGILAGMQLCPHLSTRLGMRWALPLSFLISSAGLLMLSGVAAGDPYTTGVLPGMLVTSLGCGLTLPLLAAAAVTGTTPENAGLGSALFSSVQQIGGAIGVAVLVTVAERHSGTAAGPPRAQGFSFALMIAAAILFLGAVLLAALFRTHRSTEPSAATPTDRISTGGQNRPSAQHPPAIGT